MGMFSRILIANRGEIACRIAASASRLGIEVVAVATFSDRFARHVEFADVVVLVDSYVDASGLLAAARDTGAEAIHPGYGFLSENPDFVESVESAGLVFVGPSSSAIRVMGLKSAAKRLMEEHGVSVIGGYHGDEQGADFLAVEADRLGYPLLIKASAGGGGKGIRLVERSADFLLALEEVRSEAGSIFGDSACLLEKYISRPRHIEVQIFCDRAGNGVYISERDCSVQRRHQKIIEESPAPNLSSSVREAMGLAALRAASAIGYSNAGTVEFIYDSGSEDFMFMEMNTRLQVEHPVSEAISGFDFVEWQFRLAAGESLWLRQEDIEVRGHAFEVRLCAEDAVQGFMPCVGRLDYYDMPSAEEFEVGVVRLDSGVRLGDRIGASYDSMLGKLIVWGEDRASALSCLRDSLYRCRIAPLRTNIGFLSALVEHDDFVRGDVHTGLIEDNLECLLLGIDENSSGDSFTCAFAAVVGAGLLSVSVPFSLGSFQIWGRRVHYVSLYHAGAMTAYSISVSDGGFAVEWCGGEYFLTWHALALDSCGHVILDNDIYIFRDGRRYHYCFSLGGALSAVRGEDKAYSPLPARVQEIFVEAGQEVKSGDKLIVLEAMKMQYTIVAPYDSEVKALCVEVGDQLNEGALLLEFASAQTSDGCER